MTPAQEAEIEAKKTFELFIIYSKKVTLVAVFFLLIVVFKCNNGVEEGEFATGSKYNGEVYSPTNMGKDK
mgnify:CR=1 FL=1|tara:strand:+ start:1224 stop:1433 length:210 start_codon:yes stop_codon:yes gene_type:complete